MQKNKAIERDKKAAQIPGGKVRKLKANNLTLSTSTAPATLKQPLFPADSSGGVTIADTTALADAQNALMNSRYQQALTTSLDGLHALGIFVAPDGTLFQGAPGQDWSNYNSLTGTAWLPLQNIQQIENANGTAGTLMLHLQEPEIAKNTAGYDGGSSSTFTNSAPTASTPIATVQSLPPVAATSGGTVFIDPGTATAVLTSTGNIPTSSSTNSSLPTTSTATAAMSSLVGGGKYWWIWYAIAAVIIIIYLKYAKK